MVLTFAIVPSLKLKHVTHTRTCSNLKFPELSNPSVCMRDPLRVQEILQSMVKAGSNTVQVKHSSTT